MPEPWIKVKVGIRSSDKLASLPTDSARWAWIVALCEAKLQRRMGLFVGRAQLVDLLGRRSRYFDSFLRVGLLHLAPGLCDDCRRRYGELAAGAVVIHDYLKEQRDPTNADRQADYRGAAHNSPGNAERNGPRNRPHNAERNGPLTRAGDDGDSDISSLRSDKPPSLRKGGSAQPRRPSPAQKVKAWLRGHELAQPVGWESSKLNELTRSFGADAVIASFEEAMQGRNAVTTRNYLRWAEQSLAPDPTPRNGVGPKSHTRSAKEVVDAFQR